MSATYKWLSSEMTDLVNNPPSASEREEMVQRPGNYHLLRPRGDALGKTSALWNQAFRSHQEQNPGCNGSLTWNLATEERRGLATRMGLKCGVCPFTSKRHNLFTEVETSAPGRKPASLNYSLQVGLSQTPLGNDGMRKILLSTNTPAPSRKSGMRHLLTTLVVRGSAALTSPCSIL